MLNTKTYSAAVPHWPPSQQFPVSQHSAAHSPGTQASHLQLSHLQSPVAQQPQVAASLAFNSPAAGATLAADLSQHSPDSQHSQLHWQSSGTHSEQSQSVQSHSAPQQQQEAVLRDASCPGISPAIARGEIANIISIGKTYFIIVTF